MKKILSLGAAAAVLSMTAVAASAAVTPEFLADSVSAGDIVSVEIKAKDEAVSNIAFYIGASEKLQYVAGSATYDGLSDESIIEVWVEDNMGFAGYDSYAADETILTLDFVVADDVTADDILSVTVLPKEEGDADKFYAEAVEISLAGGEDEGTGDEGTGDEGTGDDPTIVPGEDEGNGDEGTTGDEGTGDEGTTGDETTNPDTGVALAVVPAVMAGAAIVVAKKRK